MWLDRFRFSSERTKTVEPPTTYQPRAARFPLDLPVSFVGADRKYYGRTVDVSESGLLARFDDPPEIWTTGQILLEVEQSDHRIEARVARLHGEDVGFAFTPMTEDNRTAISNLIGSVSSRLSA